MTRYPNPPSADRLTIFAFLYRIWIKQQRSSRNARQLQATHVRSRFERVLIESGK